MTYRFYSDTTTEKKTKALLYSCNPLVWLCEYIFYFIERMI